MSAETLELRNMIKLEKNVPLIGRVNMKDADVKAFADAEHGDYFFIPCTNDYKETQSYYSTKFNRVKNRINKTHFKLVSRSVDGGMGFWFIDLKQGEDEMNLKP
jgi:hypothetical protein